MVRALSCSKVKRQIEMREINVEKRREHVKASSYRTRAGAHFATFDLGGAGAHTFTAPVPPPLPRRERGRSASARSSWRWSASRGTPP
eukprot:scaffold44632_cov63-Phaeocystis_antarctica.AAC.2